MQAKRNSVSNSSLFNSKTNNLIQPLISISKASTPLRTRIIGSNNMQPNSTPINFSKAAVLNNKSPNNKENFNNNHIKLQSSMKTFTIPSEPQNRINLSPIISLNRKLSEGPKFQQKKSHTPQNHKVMQEYQMNMVSSGRQGKQKRYQTLTGSNSGFNNFSNTGNFSNLRGSNSFKNLIEGRCKTPNKDTTTSSLFPLKRQTPLLKQSSSSNLLFKNFHNQESKFQNNLKLAQSKSYDKMKTFSSINSDFSEIKCMNNDGKKAKYRVLNNDDYDSEQKSEIQLYYCSKCTIPLVQQGFIVEEIGKQSIKIDISGNDRILDEIRQKLQNKKKAFIFAINDIQSKQQQQVSQLQMYYNKMFEYLESQRQKDLNLICQYYNEKKDISKDYINEIDHKIAYLQNKSLPITKILNDHSISSLIDINQNHFLIDSKFQINSAQLFNKFIETFNAYLKLHLQQNKQAKFNDISNRNHAMRFSFQKLLNDKNTKKGGVNIKNYMNPLKEQDEEQNDDEDVQTENTAFRDLFPADEQESSHLNNDMTSPTFKKI